MLRPMPVPLDLLYSSGGGFQDHALPHRRGARRLSFIRDTLAEVGTMPQATLALKRLDAYRWEIPVDYKPGMRVPGLIYADEALLPQIQEDQAIEQVANAATLPGIVRWAIAMPDIHGAMVFPSAGSRPCAWTTGWSPQARWATISTAASGS